MVIFAHSKFIQKTKNMKKIVSTLFVAMLCFVIGATAQVKTVTGRVTDEKGDAVPFASVVIKGKGTARTGTAADATGSFSIKVKKGDVLEVSAVGFQSQTFTYADQSSLGFSLKAGDNTPSQRSGNYFGVRNKKKFEKFK